MNTLMNPLNGRQFLTAPGRQPRITTHTRSGINVVLAASILAAVLFLALSAGLSGLRDHGGYGDRVPHPRPGATPSAAGHDLRATRPTPAPAP